MLTCLVFPSWTPGGEIRKGLCKSSQGGGRTRNGDVVKMSDMGTGGGRDASEELLFIGRGL